MLQLTGTAVFACALITSASRTANDPRTPNPRRPCSKRSWDGQVRKWRRLLHQYDPPGSAAGEAEAEAEAEAEDAEAEAAELRSETSAGGCDGSDGADDADVDAASASEDMRLSEN